MTDDEQLSPDEKGVSKRGRIDDDTTTNPATRHPYTNDVLSGVLLVGVVAMFVAAVVAAGVYDSTQLVAAIERLSKTLLGQTLAGMVAAMTVWLYGEGTVAAVRKALGK